MKSLLGLLNFQEFNDAFVYTRATKYGEGRATNAFLNLKTLVRLSYSFLVPTV